MSFIPRAPIWHFSMTHIWEECPNCKAYNKAQKWITGSFGNDGFYQDLPECPECGQPFDWSPEALERAAVYAKDYPRPQFLESN